MDAGVIVVGAGVAGLVATAELADADKRVLSADGPAVPGLWAAGEIAGFGGGVHGYRSLDGTSLGGCIFSGRQAGRALAEQA